MVGISNNDLQRRKSEKVLDVSNEDYGDIGNSAPPSKPRTWVPTSLPLLGTKVEEQPGKECTGSSDPQ